MKIIFVIGSLSSKGGAEHALINLVAEIKSRGHEPQIIYLWEPNDFTISLNDMDIKIHSLCLRSRWSLFAGFFRLLKIIKHEKPDILNAINFFPMLYCSITKPFSSKISRVVSYHNMGYESYPALTFVKRARKALDIILNKFIDGHTAVSTAVADSYQKHLGLKEIRTISNIIPAKKILSSLQKLDSIPSLQEQKMTQYTIIMAGRLVPEKGYNFMIPAMSLLIEKGMCVKLEIYGEGPLSSEINSSIQKFNLSNYISINPTVDHKTLFNNIFHSDLFVLSSISEGLPMAAAEAMVIGTPVIATKVGGLPEMIEDQVSGILVAPRDFTALANAIENVLCNQSLHRKLSAGGILRIQEKYGSDKVCMDLINFCQEVIQVREQN